MIPKSITGLKPENAPSPENACMHGTPENVSILTVCETLFHGHQTLFPSEHRISHNDLRVGFGFLKK
jgi:hypothetical protein